MTKKLKKPAKKIPDHQARAVAVAAGADPRTVVRLVEGKNVRPMTAARIVQAMQALGLGELLKQEAVS